jgi:hypothetical protein
LNFILLAVTAFTFLIGSYIAVDDSEAHYKPAPKKQTESDDDGSMFNFSMTLDGLEPIYDIMLAWKWYIILY